MHLHAILTNIKFRRPAVSNDNPDSGAVFKTLKYSPQYPSKPFESVEDTLMWNATSI